MLTNGSNPLTAADWWGDWWDHRGDWGDHRWCYAPSGTSSLSIVGEPATAFILRAVNFSKWG